MLLKMGESVFSKVRPADRLPMLKWSTIGPHICANTDEIQYDIDCAIYNSNNCRGRGCKFKIKTQEGVQGRWL